MDDIQLWITTIANYGFPVVITIYLLLRFEKKIETLETTIQALTEVIKSSKY